MSIIKNSIKPNKINNLAIFDLDNTLLAGDSDALWGQFIAQHGHVNKEEHERENLRFYEAYKAGTLDIYEFLEFSLKPLSELDMAELTRLHQIFMQESILPIISQQARDLVNYHRENGDILLIITATNRFITAPIAKEFGIDNLLATDAEIVNNQYTGKVSGTPCFQEGKVVRLNEWLVQTGYTLENSWFYSDSHNDIPLLEKVNFPIAVDPDEKLAEHAELKDWKILQLHPNATM